MRIPFLIGLTPLLFSISVAAAPLGDASEPIKIPFNEWTGQHISAMVLGSLLEKLGYQPIYVTAGSVPQISGLEDGSLSVQPEVWTGNIGENYTKAKDSGGIVVVGELGLDAKDGWIYTPATKEVCPGLPDWKALLEPACAEALATPETLPNGRLLDYPADWGTVSATVLQENAIPFTAVPAGSEGALVAELQSAVAAKTPLLMRFWAPHWVLAETEIGWVEMPPCTAPDSEKGSRCIVVPPVLKIAWSGFAAKWPAAAQLAGRFRLSAEDQQAMIHAVDQDKKRIEDVVADWISKREAAWTPWVEEASK